jgi:hypothetical protein
MKRISQRVILLGVGVGVSVAVGLGANAAEVQQPLTQSQEFNQELLELAASNGLDGQESAQSANAHLKPYGAIIAAAKWKTNKVFVCWENGTANDQVAMAWTREAVELTWVQESGLTFSGWQPCAVENAGIRIRISDEGPHVKSLGNFLDGKPNGMVLNFTFNSWSTECKAKLEHCVKTIAVHEFGHAIGFAHEQNRPDAPGECKMIAQGSRPDTMLTPYDKDSVMNYCNKKWNNDGFLSQLDIEAVRELYGNPTI